MGYSKEYADNELKKKEGKKMKKKEKKLVALLMAAAMSLSMIACGGKTETKDTKDTKTDVSTDTAAKNDETSDTAAKNDDATDTEPAGGVVTLEFWNPGTEGLTAEENYLVRNIEDFNKEYAGKIQINITQIGGESDNQSQKYQMAASADRLPDLMIMNADKYLRQYIEGGDIANMSDYLGDKEFTSRFTDSALELQGNACYSEKELYAIANETEIQGWYYNSALFEKYGLKIPETFDELLNCVKVFKENGITPIAHGGLEQWPLWGYWAWYSRLGFTQEENYWNDFADGSLKLADCESLRKVFDYMVKLQQAGAYPDNVTTINNTQAQETFLAGDAAIYCGGSWMVGDMDESEIAENIVFNWGPEFEDGVLDAKCGMRPYSWCITFGASLDKDPARKEAAATFIKWITSEDRVKIELEEYGHIPAVSVDTTSLSAIGPVGNLTVEVATDNSVISVIDPNSWCSLDGSTTVIWNAMTSIISGTIGTDEALSQLQDWVDRQ